MVYLDKTIQPALAPSKKALRSFCAGPGHDADGDDIVSVVESVQTCGDHVYTPEKYALSSSRFL